MEKDILRSNFFKKVVYLLECKICDEQICRRGMRAILLADTRVKLFSTDAIETR